MTYLLDVNVLIALLDQNHVDHDRTIEWFQEVGAAGWATCPLTENGLIRILGHARYPKGPGTPTAAATLLAGLTASGRHHFWSDGISLLDGAVVHVVDIPNSAAVTDTYLVALAVSRGGTLATLDRRLTAVAVPDGADHLYVIP